MTDETIEKKEPQVKAEGAAKPKGRAKPAPEAVEAKETVEVPEPLPPVVEKVEKIEKLDKAEKPKIKLPPVPAGVQYRATGRRKESVARLYLSRGEGTITINGRPANQFLFRGTNMLIIRQPLELTGTTNLFDIRVNVRGGGQTGQAGAIKQALARALCSFHPELRTPLKKAGHLTRDDREVERKKYGQAKARKRFQFSKR